MVLPRHLGQRRFRLRAGRVEHQHVNGTQAGRDRGDERGDLLLVGDISGERIGGPAFAADSAGHLGGLPVPAQAIDGHGQAIPGEAPRDDPAQSSRAARHQGDATLSCLHAPDHSAPPRSPPAGARGHRARCNCVPIASLSDCLAPGK